MIKYLGNSKIDWTTVIRDLESQAPAEIGPKHKEGDPIPGLKEVVNLWNNAEYKTVAQGGTVGWDMFYPGQNFDADIVDQFINEFNLKELIPKVHTAWISRIHPGHFAPMHWDVQDNEEQLATEPDYVRFHCHIGAPEFGHIFIVDNECLYNQTQGSSYQWDSRKAWHAGTNCGLVPKYIFNLW
jgi:hypothetical protein